MRLQLSAVLDHFQSLQAIDTSDVEPTGHSTEIRSVMRDDEAEECLRRDEVLANAPHTEDDYFRVLPPL